MIKFKKILCLFALFFFLTAGNSFADSLFNAEEFTLDNGMQVVVISNHRAPIVTHMVWYKVGAADELPAEYGIAHFHEHLMFRGTKNVPAYEFSKIISRNGGVDNAFTSQDFTAYHQNIAVDRLGLVMEMEADRMMNLVLDEEGFNAERKVVIEERLSRYDNNPSALFSERLREMLWHTHPYGKPVIGFMKDIINLDLNDVIDFHNRWYAPNNAVLVVAGDITAEQLKPLAEKYYGIIPARKLPKRDRIGKLSLPIKARIEMKHKQVRQPSLVRYYIAPSYNTAKDGQAYALQILSEILGGDNTSKLYRSLVVKQKVAVSAGSWYNPNSASYGTFGIYASPQVGENIKPMENALHDELKKFLVTEKDVEKAKKRLCAGLVYLKDKASSGANILGKSLAVGLTLNDVESWAMRIEKVTPEDVMKAAHNIFENASSVTGILMPEKVEK